MGAPARENPRGPDDATWPRPPTTKVSILLSSLRGGGAERQLLLLAAGLTRRSWNVDLVLINRRDSVYQIPRGVSVVDLHAPRIRYAISGLIRYLLKARPAVLLSAETPVNALAIVSRLISRVPVRLVVSERNHLSSVAGSATRLADRLRPLLVRLLYPRADTVVAVSRDVTADLIRTGQLSQQKVRTLHNMVDVHEVVRQSHQKMPLSIVLPRGVPVILNVGRLVPQKDQQTLLRAFAIVAGRRPCRLVILGEGPERPALEELARQLGVASSVSMPGFAANPYSYMAEASVFVLSSAWEGLPGALIEAMACGVPVVSTDCPGGSAEILDGGRYGTLIPIRNAEALAEAIQQTLEHPLPSARLRRRARDFSVESILPQYAALLNPDPRQNVRSS